MTKTKKKLTLTESLLQDIEVAMNNSSNEMQWYLDIQKEETTFIMEYAGLDEEEEGEEGESLREMIENDIDGERFVAIPLKQSYEGWNQMERFILGLEDEKTRDLLLITIQGSGAFSRFKDAVFRLGLDQEWFEFKNREDRKEVLEWLHSLDLIDEKGVEQGLQLYEDWLKKMKQREKDIEDMVKGVQVKCIYDSGHEDKLTIGKTYQVIDERKEHLNIRITDDRGKVVWMPKSHFELMR